TQKRGPSRALIVLAVLLALAACGVVGLVAAVLAQTGAGNSVAAPQATATATPSPRQLAEAYVELVSRDANTLSTAMGTVSDQCAVDVSACDTAVVAAAKVDQSFLHDIQDAKVPACLNAADSTLQDALSAMYAGLIDSHTGIQAQDGALVTQGAHEITAATVTTSHATKLIAQVKCS
ncbi:MAG TPA: hypothetical protein VJO13_09040, partial [Ktedonobacterales bacterium]|nr:hypothetical protein [Ktedonobacterales bacterium]